MHYVRFLKPPQITKGVLAAKLTITNDLGDEFLAAELNLLLRIIPHGDLHDVGSSRVVLQPSVVQWKGGMRELAISIPLPAGNWKGAEEKWCLQVWPLARDGIAKAIPGRGRGKVGHEIPIEEEEIFLQSFREVLAVGRQDRGVKSQGMVLAAISAPFSSSLGEQSIPAEIYRTFAGNDFHGEELSIVEECGNSIARHIWDAGVVLSALLEEMGNPEPSSPSPRLPLLQQVLSPAQDQSLAFTPEEQINILELGTGCAIVASTLATVFPYANLIATDLEDAREVASTNLDRNFDEEDVEEPARFEVLDWTEELPEEIESRKWDVVILADCTYNSDVVPALVNTLRRIVDASPQVLICVALKWRHDSEAVFHDLMAEKRLRVVDKHVERVSNYDVEATGKEEEVEVYLFKGEEEAEGRGEKGRPREEKEGEVQREWEVKTPVDMAQFGMVRPLDPVRAELDVERASGSKVDEENWAKFMNLRPVDLVRAEQDVAKAPEGGGRSKRGRDE